MRKLFLALAGAALVLCAQTMSKLNYPSAPRGDQVDDYHGTKIADPHRELENADSPATKKWVEEENAVTFGYLAKLPGRDSFRKQLTELWDYERFAGMFKAGDHYFYSHNTGLQNQNVVMVQDAMNGPSRVLLDPNTYRKDGTAALNGESPSWGGKLLGYAVAQAGSDWSDWHVRDIASGNDLPDVIHWTKSSGLAWTADDRGFFYSRYPEPPPDKLLTAAMANSTVYMHRLGSAQSADKLVYQRPENPAWMFGPQVTDDGRYLILSVNAGDAGKDLLFYQDLQSAAPKMTELISKFEYRYEFAGNVGPLFYIHTTDGAARGRVIAINIEHPEKANWKEVVAEGPDTLESVVMADGKLLLGYMKDAHSAARLVDLDGKSLQGIEFAGLGTAVWSGARQTDRELFYAYTGFTMPAAIYRLDLEAGQSTLVHQSKVSFDPGAFETRQVFYPSKDGTRIPMFLCSRKGLPLDGQNPTLLYGYGGFNIAITPAFNPAYIEWMNEGGILAVANLRGGSEYGESWHEAGTKAHKQNVFDDFIAAAEYLIANKYTSTPKLAIYGGSNGGLLVGAVLNQRPDLFGAAMPAVGVMDMLRFQKFTFGAFWVGDYGSSDNAADFPVLRAYSPLQNIRKGAHYPPTLITTSDHDDRVVPGHSFKYAATLQEAQGGPAPILIRIETRAGHGAGKPTSKTIDEWADRLAFLTHALGMKAGS